MTPWVEETVSMTADTVLADGVVVPPVTFDRIVWLAIVARAIVPVDVIVPPLKPVPAITDVTANAHCGFALAPCVCKKKPAVPGAKFVQTVALL